MIVGSRLKELEGTRKYVATGKEADPLGGKEDLAYWFLADRISNTFAGESATVGEIYYSVTRSLGMSSSETAQLITEARRQGYLKNV